MIPETFVLNQYGFILFIGVSIDTFVIRTVIVPAVVTIMSRGDFHYTLWGKYRRFDVNWWPGMMPEPILPPEKEKEALLAGYKEPPIEYLDKPSQSTDDREVCEQGGAVDSLDNVRD